MPTTLTIQDEMSSRQTVSRQSNSSGTGLRTENYMRNRLNQYSQKDEAATFDVLGLANASATVTVNGSSTYRKGEYFQKELTVSNGSVPVWQSVSTIASLGGSSVTNTGNMYLAKTPEVYAHDLDGNLTSDGHWNYTWDAENRLTMQQTIGTAPTGAKKQLVFEYDWMGRRIRKQVYDWISSAWTLTQDERFLYDGWNVVAVLSSSTTIKKTLLWGLDLSGTMQGAGGVGGLLALTDYPSSKTYFAGYDGNGNVTTLTDAVSGLTEGNFEYGPFGELIRASGTAAAVCPWRFSTKYEDSETGMLYYGYRYYSANTGRWLSRDPIEERGGINLSVFSRNRPIGTFDSLGLQEGTNVDPNNYIPSPDEPPAEPGRNNHGFQCGWTEDRKASGTIRVKPDGPWDQSYDAPVTLSYTAHCDRGGAGGQIRERRIDFGKGPGFLSQGVGGDFGIAVFNLGGHLVLTKEENAPRSRPCPQSKGWGVITTQKFLIRWVKDAAASISVSAGPVGTEVPGSKISSETELGRTIITVTVECCCSCKNPRHQSPYR